MREKFFFLGLVYKEIIDKKYIIDQINNSLPIQSFFAVFTETINIKEKLRKILFEELKSLGN